MQMLSLAAIRLPSMGDNCVSILQKEWKRQGSKMLSISKIIYAGSGVVGG